MAAPRAIAGGIYYLSGVLVKAETKEVAKKLIAKGFRTATDGIKNSGLKVQTVTNSNFVTYVTRALKKAMEQSQKIRQGPKLDPKTGRPVGRGEGTNKLGGSGQSAIGRKLGSRRMANFGKVRGGKGRAESMAKSKPKPQSSVKPVSARPGNFRTGKQDKVNPAVSPAATIAGLIAAGALGKVAWDAYIENNSPTVTQINAAEKKLKAAAKDNRRQPSKEGSLVGDAGTESKRQEARRILKFIEAKKLEDKKRKTAELTAGQSDAQAMVDARYTGSGVPTLTDKQRRELKKELAEITRKKPVRPKLRPKVVEAEPMSLRSYLNAEIKSRKSTVTKEKAKAKKGNYKSIAEAKKAKSLYYIKDGKTMAAVYKRDLKGL